MNNTIPVLDWDERGELFTRERATTCPVPREVVEWLNHRIIGCAHHGFFFPCDPRDAYQTVFLEVEKAARRLESMPLEKAHPVTYLISVVNIAIRHFHIRTVLRRRQEYRTVERSLVAAEISANAKVQRDAPEGKDVGYAISAAATESCNSEVELGGKNPAYAVQPMTAQQLSEVLPSHRNATERRDAARAELALIFAKLPDEVVRAFAAYIAANGNLFAAAHIAHIGKNRYYRSWPKWLKLARKAAGK